jgi:DNA-directed RNA polymerase
LRRRVRGLARKFDSLLSGEEEARRWLEKHPELKRELEELKAIASIIPTLLPVDVRPSPEWRQRTKESLLARLRRRRKRRAVA